mmetsp:Transcript_29074/g.68521  ORF Transcript_29074/g.68521 Transcript_29074/m.68521 type:complete len:121 (-) Transcript_29074:108-470(-)
MGFFYALKATRAGFFHNPDPAPFANAWLLMPLGAAGQVQRIPGRTLLPRGRRNPWKTHGRGTKNTSKNGNGKMRVETHIPETMTTMALEIIEAINVGEMHFAIRTEGCMLANVPDANSFR